MGAIKDFVDNYTHWAIFLFGVMAGTILTFLFDHAWPWIVGARETMRILFGG